VLAPRKVLITFGELRFASVESYSQHEDIPCIYLGVVLAPRKVLITFGELRFAPVESYSQPSNKHADHRGETLIVTPSVQNKE